MKAIIYCRKSTDREDMQQLSLDSQIDEAYKLAEQNGYEIVKVVKESMSAKQPGRPEFTKMMQMFYDGKAETIVTWKLNRLARNPVDEGTIKWAIQNGVIKVIHTADGIFKTGDNVLVMGMYFGMSTQYVIELKKDIERGMQKKVRSGDILGRVPVGYVNNKLEKTVEIDEERAPFVKRIFELRAQKIPFKNIRKIVTEEGFRTRKGGKISTSRIEGIIKSRFYYGLIKFSGEYYKGKYKPLVSKELWDIANDLKKGVSYTKHEGEPLFKLKGIIKNYHTGKALTASLIKKKYIYYHLHHRQKGVKIWINQNEIIKHFDENINFYGIPKKHKNEIIDGIKDFYSGEIALVQKEKMSIKRQLSTLKTKKKSLLKMRANDELTKEEFLEEKNEITETETGLNHRLENLSKANNDILEKLSKTVELLINLPAKRKSMKISQKLELIKFMMVELNYDHKKRLHIKEKPLFEIIRNENLNNWWSLSHQ